MRNVVPFHLAEDVVINVVLAPHGDGGAGRQEGLNRLSELVKRFRAVKRLLWMAKVSRFDRLGWSKLTPRYGPRLFTGDRSPHSTGRRRLLCPHLLGWNKHRRLQVLCYQYGGDSESGLQPAGASDNWRCLAVEYLSQVELIDGPWHTAENHSRLQT